MAGANLDTYGTGTIFRDVPSGAWYASAALWAYDKGVTKGVGGGLFAPDAVITEWQFETMLIRHFIGASQESVRAKIPATRGVAAGMVHDFDTWY
jgi:hypothetical protein